MIRAIKRQMAKSRMADMGYDHINKRMGTSNGNRINKRIYRKMLRTQQGRARWTKASKEQLPVWRRVMEGDLLKRALSAQQRGSDARCYSLHGCPHNEWVRIWKQQA